MDIRNLFRYRKQEAEQTQVEELEPSIAKQEQESVSNDSSKDEELFRHAFDYATVGTALIAPSGHFLKVNRALYNIFGYSEDELSKLSLQDLTSEEDLELLQEHLTKLVDGTLQTAQIEQRIKHKQGHFLWATWTASQPVKASDNASYLIFQLQGISHRKRSEKRNALSSLHDPLTGLPNRVLLMERLQVAFKRASLRPDKRFAVFFIDFDRFGLVAENLTEVTDEQLNLEIARRLERLLQTKDVVAKLSGNEFAVLLEDLKDVEEALQTAEQLQKEFAKPLTLNGHEISVTLCIGIAIWSREYERPEFLLRDANSAFYQAKRLGGARYELFDSEVHKRARYHLQLETDLRSALEHTEFCLHYQPVIELKSCRLMGFEALIRWQHPTRGLISPIEFISIAEENGLISPIGLWVLQEACRQLSVWQKRHHSNGELWMSVNVSGKQIIESNFVEQVLKTLRETGVSPRNLKLEVTESAMINNIEFAVNALKELKQHGVKMSVDDFGTGYSSLSNLHRLPIDTLKIDRSFVANMQGSDENWEIIKSVIKLGQTLNLEVIAEGVETGEQVVNLQSLACSLGQGYYFAQPLTSTAVETLFNELQNADAKTPIIDELMIEHKTKTIDDLMTEYFDNVAV